MKEENGVSVEMGMEILPTTIMDIKDVKLIDFLRMYADISSKPSIREVGTPPEKTTEMDSAYHLPMYFVQRNGGTLFEFRDAKELIRINLFAADFDF